MIDPASLIPTIESLSYVGIFIALLLVGYLIPVPEEVLLILIGYSVSEGIGSLFPVILVSIAGLYFGDNALYYLTRKGNEWILKIRRRIR